MKKITLPLLLAVLLSACATPTVTEVRKTGDSNLDCAQINTEYAAAQKFEADARKERTVTGTNVAAAILFWPALLGTYANSGDAIEAAKSRQAHLEKLADAKKCKIG